LISPYGVPNQLRRDRSGDVSELCEIEMTGSAPLDEDSVRRYLEAVTEKSCSENVPKLMVGLINVFLEDICHRVAIDLPSITVSHIVSVINSVSEYAFLRPLAAQLVSEQTATLSVTTRPKRSEGDLLEHLQIGYKQRGVRYFDQQSRSVPIGMRSGE
jgi:hypothetical protein